MIANLVEGAFGRAFRSEVRPMELARKLAHEMDEHRTPSLSRTYAPNEYHVWLSPQDREHYEDVEQDVIDELCAHLLEHARREELVLGARLSVLFHTDRDLRLGEFGIQARSTRPELGAEPAPARSAARPGTRRGLQTGLAEVDPDEHGKTMIYSSSERLRGPIEEGHARRSARPLLLVSGRRMVLPPGGGVIGRSRECDVVLDDTGISRRHAELRPSPQGWTIADLRSTNGVRVNDRPIEGAQVLRSGDRIELGSTRIVFEQR
ncbi:MAG: DUF3662 and FHA domain-containing protein [Solirubrobacterales bacterium]|nr:DUF3662 and FHA domain-containing protein [Solirubrobacterales bacterium]